MTPRRIVSAVRRRGTRAVERSVRGLERAALPGLHVFAYHRIARPGCDPWDLAVAPDTFDQQLGVLRAHGSVLAIDEALERRRSLVPGGRPRFVVTFDDGYVDNLNAALIVLERHDAPATVFVPTWFIDAPHFWWDRMALLVLRAGVPVHALRASLARAGVVVPSPDGGEHDVDAFHLALHEQITWLGPAEIDDVLDRVVGDLGIEPLVPDGRPMTTAELRVLAAHPLITIGAHTVHHRLLTRLPPDQVRRELESCTARLDELLGRRLRPLAYPHGDADRSTARIAGRAGFTRALTTVDRVTSMFDRPLLLPRRHPKDVPAEAFEAWLAAG